MTKIDFKNFLHNYSYIPITIIGVIIALLSLHMIIESRRNASIIIQQKRLAWIILTHLVEPYEKYYQKSLHNISADSITDTWSNFFLFDFENSKSNAIYLDQIITETNNKKTTFCLIANLKKDTKVFIIVDQNNQYIIIGNYEDSGDSFFIYLDSSDYHKIYLLHEKLDVDLFSNNFHQISMWGQSKKKKG
ncbi:MAG: hypothetical protein LBU34_01770, partial [Planctomycetaceae bacterium]|nr:hypothetical protein [Planctomycetaceae bacterium]